ncbi:hypothetical protein NPIL_683811 [Nephila pilipes]|uniref:Uncharacterized protein n=1 Tax=Nephila pilipes TaxID=299642 RepID=A0A8X6Q2P6_NEPPI|nr:hypothetical protein NPIL_683811 [Nephila pilipes]
MKTTFVYDYKRFVYITCYSSNLHIYGSEEVETTYSDETFGHHKRMNNFITVIPEFDSFYPWTVPRILLSVHSPFVPIDPFDGELLEKNHEYFIKFRLKICSLYDSDDFAAQGFRITHICILNCKAAGKFFFV